MTQRDIIERLMREQENVYAHTNGCMRVYTIQNTRGTHLRGLYIGTLNGLEESRYLLVVVVEKVLYLC